MKCLQVEEPCCEHEDEDRAGMDRKGQVLEGALQLSSPSLSSLSTQGAVPDCAMLGSLPPIWPFIFGTLRLHLGRKVTSHVPSFEKVPPSAVSDTEMKELPKGTKTVPFLGSR